MAITLPSRPIPTSLQLPSEYTSLSPDTTYASDSHLPVSPLTTPLPANPCHALSGMTSIINKLPNMLSCCMDAPSVSFFYQYLNFAQDVTCSVAVSRGGCSFPHHPTVPHTHTQIHRTHTLYHVAWRGVGTPFIHHCSSKCSAPPPSTEAWTTSPVLPAFI